MPKQLLRYEGKTLLRRVAETACGVRNASVTVLLGAESTQCLREVADLPLSVMLVPDWTAGMGSTLSTGVQTLDETCDRLLVMLCDQPLVTTAHLESLLVLATPTNIVASAYNEIQGVPCVFGRAFFDELRALSGDIGARQVIRRHPESVLTVLFPDGAVDIDTTDDWGWFTRPSCRV
jgi:molybdenum cofactor cytidylyltransferase